MSAIEWIAKRRELLDEFLKPYRGRKHDNVGLLILARSDLPRALDALDAVLALHRGEWACVNPRHTSLGIACDACGVVCDCCGEAYPCPSITSIEAALGGGDDD